MPIMADHIIIAIFVFFSQLSNALIELSRVSRFERFSPRKTRKLHLVTPDLSFGCDVAIASGQLSGRTVRGQRQRQRPTEAVLASSGHIVRRKALEQ